MVLLGLSLPALRLKLTPLALMVLRISNSDWNGSPGFPICWLQNLGLLMLHNHVGQFFIIKLSSSLCVCVCVCVCVCTTYTYIYMIYKDIYLSTYIYLILFLWRAVPNKIYMNYIGNIHRDIISAWYFHFSKYCQILSKVVIQMYTSTSSIQKVPIVPHSCKYLVIW